MQRPKSAKHNSIRYHHHRRHRLRTTATVHFNPLFMPHRPTESHQKDSPRHKSTKSHHFAFTNHGNSGKNGIVSESILLRIPSESLTHITSFLDPASLLALARVNKQLYDHVNEDNTWRRAFVCQFLGISPESDLRDDKARKLSMLRRQETTWKREFVRRYNLRRYVFENSEWRLKIKLRYHSIFDAN